MTAKITQFRLWAVQSTIASPEGPTETYIALTKHRVLIQLAHIPFDHFFRKDRFLTCTKTIKIFKHPMKKQIVKVSQNLRFSGTGEVKVSLIRFVLFLRHEGSNNFLFGLPTQSASTVITRPLTASRMSKSFITPYVLRLFYVIQNKVKIFPLWRILPLNYFKSKQN